MVSRVWTKQLPGTAPQHMGLQPFYGKGPNPLPWAGSCALREKINVIPRRINYCVTSIKYARFTNVATVFELETHAQIAVVVTAWLLLGSPRSSQALYRF